MAKRVVIKGFKSSGNPIPPPPPSGQRPGGRQVGTAKRSKVITGDRAQQRQQRDQIIQEAYQEAERIRGTIENYRMEGQQQGNEAGQNIGKAEWLVSLLIINRNNEQLFKHFEKEVANLSRKISEKIIGYSLRLPPATILKAVAEQLQSIYQVHHIQMSVHPDDAAMIQSQRPALFEKIEKAPDITLNSHPQVEQGRSILETTFGTIEGALEDQVNALQRVFLGS